MSCDRVESCVRKQIETRQCVSNVMQCDVMVVIMMIVNDKEVLL